MAALTIRMARALTVVAALNFTATAAFARAAGTAHDRWNSAHIDQLPPQIRHDLERRCGPSLRAEHDFATYLRDGREIVLHYEHLRCGAQPGRLPA